MNLSLEIIYKLIIAFIAFYMFYRFIPLIIQYIEKSKDSKSNKGRSIDQMIREQEVLLRKGMSDNNPKNTSTRRDKQKKKTIEDLLYRYKEVDGSTNDSHEFNYDSIIDLLENLQWGESETSKLIEKNAFKNFGITVQSTGVNRTIKENFRSDFFQGLPNFEQIEEFIISYNILLKIVNENETSQISKEISKNNSLLIPKHIIKGAHLLLIKK